VNRVIRITEDGSATIFIPELDEHYHSTHGAVQESKHVFIEMGLKSFSKKDIRIFEFGFGTGLNALLTLLDGIAKSITYHSMELYPIDWSVIEKLGYHMFLGLPATEIALFKKMHMEKSDIEFLIRPNFSFKKIKASIIDFTHTEKYDLVYYDAFSPEVQPELWGEEIFLKLYNSMCTNGRLVTYCAKGEVRRRLQRVGFSVERLQGPPGKWEMLRAVRSPE
jgi:tRNA U34 5-methylaminomethyl-2-thiouridine-forming methyltransferase MnmC